jgi:uncharacterized protein (DUF1501 family)
VVLFDKRQFRAGTAPRPPSLESHADQTFQTQTAGIFGQENGSSGWAGRATDQLESFNAAASIFANISLSGQNVLQSGQAAVPFVVDGSGSFDVSLSRYVAGNMGDRLRNGVRGLLSTSPHVFAGAYGATKGRALDGNAALSRALAGAAVPAGFPATGLGRQLRTVAQIMSVAPSLGVRRQTFFCGTGGFDTHADQNHAQPGLLSGLAQAMAAFYQHTVAVGLEDSVTTFTASEFARTFAMNGSLGTDHAWGGVQFVLGGAVRGGFYGTMPDQTLGGPDDVGTQGRFIPTLAVDQIASTLALWFGVSPSRLGEVAPGVGNFGTADLGFMASG